MNLNEQYAGACASWVRYSRYEFRQFPDGVRVMPAADAVPQLYNPLETAWEMLAEGMELGRQRRQDLADIDEAVLRFAERYGLLGIAADLPSDRTFSEAGRSSFRKTTSASRREQSPSGSTWTGSFRRAPCPTRKTPWEQPPVGRRATTWCFPGDTGNG